MKSIIKKLLSRFSVEVVKTTLKRFPVTVIYLQAFIAALITFVWLPRVPDKLVYVLLFYLFTGGVIDFLLSLFWEEKQDKKRHKVIQFVSILFLSIYSIIVYVLPIDLRTSPGFILANVAILVSLVLAIPFASYKRNDTEVKPWRMITEMANTTLYLAVAMVLIYIGLFVLVAALEELFFVGGNRAWSGHFLETLLILPWGFLGLVFLMSVPRGEGKQSVSNDIPSFLKCLIKFVVFPFLCLYISILYIYLLQIMVDWELPNGTVSWLVSVVMGLYVVCYVTFYPLSTTKSNWYFILLHRVLPICILPLLVLMTVGLVRRFSDYGITAPRLYLLTALLWYYIIMIVVLVSPKVRFSWIFSSFCFLFLLTSAQPLNYYTISKYVLVSQFKKQLLQNNIRYPVYKDVYDDIIDTKHLYDIEAKERYIRWTYGADAVDKWLFLGTTGKHGHKAHSRSKGRSNRIDKDTTNLTRKDNSWCVAYHRDATKPIPIPHNYKKVQNYKLDTPYMQIHSSYLQNGELGIYDNDKRYFELDTAAIRKANKFHVMLTLDEKMAGLQVLIPSTIIIERIGDEWLFVDISGLLFTK